MLISLVDKILSHLDNNLGSPGVLATMLDWSAAFDRLCPTLGIIKFMNLGVHPALLSVISSYLSNRSMSVKFNGSTSKTYHMPGGGPQGTLLGVLEYLVQCNDNADCVSTDCRFKYVDDLTILELLYLSNLSTGISSYNHKLHVSSDIVLIIFLSLRPTFTLRYVLTQYQTGLNRIKLYLIVRNPTICYSPDLNPTTKQFTDKQPNYIYR